MNGSFELMDPADAYAWMESLPRNTRRKGEGYWREGRVASVTATDKTTVSAVVHGSAAYNVLFQYLNGDGWTSTCSCPVGGDCKHAYAVMRHALDRARYRPAPPSPPPAPAKAAETARPAAAPTPAPTAQPPPAPTPHPAPTLQALVEQALGRRLKSSECGFINRFRQLHWRVKQARWMSVYDLENLGLVLCNFDQTRVQLPKPIPTDEQQFWNYLAYATAELGGTIPAFLEPVTDFRAIRERVERQRRQEEIEQWEFTLNEVPLERSAIAPARAETVDLRLRLYHQEAVLERKRAGRADFAPLKASQVRRLAGDYQEGALVLPLEAEVLWQAFQSRCQSAYGGGERLAYDRPEDAGLLNRLLRLPALQDRLVASDGTPLERPGKALKWALREAKSEDDDYVLRVVQADGRPVGELMAVFHGQPSLYLTADALYAGPPTVSGRVTPFGETRIPAPALETAQGLQLLQAMQIALPTRLRERVREVAVDVAIRCHLAPLYAGSKSEACHFRVLAESKDGRIKKQWAGNQWLDKMPAGGGSARGGNGASAIALYNYAALQEVPRWLEPLGLKWEGYAEALVLRVTKKFPELFAAFLKSVPAHIPVQLAGDLASLAQGAVSGNVRLEVSETAIDWFDLRVVLDVEDTSLTAEEIKLLLDAKGSYVRLAGKGWRRLAFNLTAEEDERLAKLGLNPHQLSSEPQRLHALQLADESAKKFLPAEQVEQIQRRAGEIKARVTPELPAGVTAQLRPYQTEGFHFLAYLATNRFGGILADDMGLGKTVQTLAWLLWLRRGTNGAAAVEGGGPAPGHDARGPRPSLVVCPKSVMDNWRAEAERFTPGLRVKLWSASELKGLADQLGEADLHVLNYSQLRLVGEGLGQVQWLAAILDEGQYIKNPESQTAQVARSLRAEHRLVLSGTPIENRLMDLWSLLAFAMPGALGNRGQFTKLYDAKGDPFARRRLAARVRPFLLRRTKAQVAKDLPDRVEEDLFCEIEGEQRLLYRAELKRAQQLLLRVQTQAELNKERFHLLTSLLRLRQICCHPKLVTPESKAASAKMEALLEQLEPLMEEGHKVLVFSQFVELINVLKPALEEREWPVFCLTGETENRGELVASFQAAQGAAVFLLSLKAGGFGLNLTAASYVVLFDPWWNPAVENQAIDRTHRIGQSSKVMAYRLLIKNSIEEKIRALQKQKKALAEDVLGEERFAQSLTIDDLQYLFTD